MLGLRGYALGYQAKKTDDILDKITDKDPLATMLPPNDNNNYEPSLPSIDH